MEIVRWKTWKLFSARPRVFHTHTHTHARTDMRGRAGFLPFTDVSHCWRTHRVHHTKTIEGARHTLASVHTQTRTHDDHTLPAPGITDQRFQRAKTRSLAGVWDVSMESQLCLQTNPHTRLHTHALKRTQALQRAHRL